MNLISPKLHKMRPAKFLTSLFLIVFISSNYLYSQNKGIENAQRYDRLIIKNVMIVDGKGTPMKGPNDVIIENNRIAAITSVKSASAYTDEQHIIDGKGMYLLPGLINNHVHIHQRGDCPLDYLYKLWMACGITTVRDVGSDVEMTLAERQKSDSGTDRTLHNRPSGI